MSKPILSRQKYRQNQGIFFIFEPLAKANGNIYSDQEYILYAKFCTTHITVGFSQRMRKLPTQRFWRHFCYFAKMVTKPNSL